MSKDHYEDPEDLTQVRNIIKQLNEKPSQEKKREVVTRSDGSKVIRVTKRRKRMLTEMDKQKRSRKSFMLGLLMVFIIACVLGGLFFWRMVSMGSEGFLQQKEEELREIWGATSLTVTGAGIDGHVLHLDVLEAEFPESSMVRRVRMTDVEAELSSLTFLSTILHAELVKIGNLDMELNSATRHLQIPQAQKDSFWKVGRIECNNFNLIYADGSAAPLCIRNTKAYMYYPRASKEKSVVILNDGIMQMRGWQDVRIVDAKITLSSRAVEDFIIQGTTNRDEASAEELRTSIAFYGKIMDGAELAGPFLMDSDNMALADFTNARFEYFFTGRTRTTLRGRQHAKAHVLLPFEKEMPIFSGEMTLNQVCLSGFPILMQMTEHIEPTKRKMYMPVKVAAAHVKITHQEDGLQLEIPVGGMMERDLINVHGNIKVDNHNALSGKLEYGMPSVLTRVEYPDGVSDPLFREMGDWAWVSATLKGRANVPDDNSFDLESRAVDARRTRPARIPFNQIDLDRMLNEMKEADDLLKDRPLEIGPSGTNNSRNPFETQDDPFAQ